MVIAQFGQIGTKQLNILRAFIKQKDAKCKDTTFWKRIILAQRPQDAKIMEIEELFPWRLCVFVREKNQLIAYSQTLHVEAFEGTSNN
jgi:hypothetical protein